MARKRSNSVKQVLSEMESSSVADVASRRRTDKAQGGRSDSAGGSSFWQDITTFRWMTNPATSLKLILGILAMRMAWEYAPMTPKDNVFDRLLFVSYPIPRLPGDQEPKYVKGTWDFGFLAFYVLVFSFLRQAVTEYAIRPVAARLGIRGASKMQRFLEQGYAVIYFATSGCLGLYVMSKQKTWWYKTEHLWLEYPHWRMDKSLKYYYLLQFSYWLQQMLVLALRLEKPRSDYYELIIHHFVTLWLVGWSYSLNLTIIGTAIYVSMDIPDAFLGFSKCLNYLDLQRTSEASFAVFLVVWHYLRHYQNLRILWSVVKEFDLAPSRSINWKQTSLTNPNGWWLFTGGISSRTIPHWMQWQIFAPILLLQLVNAFWSFLIWRIVFRMIRGQQAKDIREEGEDEEEEDEGVKKDKKAIEGSAKKTASKTRAAKGSSKKKE